MEEYFKFILEQLSVPGFWGTSAPLYMDLIFSFLAILPILSGISILFAIRKRLKLHQLTQFLLFFLTLVVLGFFIYTFYYVIGFDLLVKDSVIDSTIVVMLLLVHGAIFTSTLVIWMLSLMYALSDKKRMALPGLYSKSHAKSGKRILKGIFLAALSSVGIYWILFLA